jgi:hypothetical protein
MHAGILAASARKQQELHSIEGAGIRLACATRRTERETFVRPARVGQQSWIAGQRCVTSLAAARFLAQAFRSRRSYRLNTNSIDAEALFLSSGRLPMTKGDCLEPASTAMYCLPLTE